MTHLDPRRLLLILPIALTASCGVKSAPTPVLDTPPGMLQEEISQRAKEASDKQKQKESRRP